MKTLKTLIVCGAMLAFATHVFDRPAAASDATDSLVVVVNPGVPVAKLSASELEAIFSCSKKNWPDGSNISAFSYAPEDATRRAFDTIVLRMSPDEVARFWLDQRVRGGARPPRQVPDPGLAARLAAKLPGSIAFIPESMVSPGLKVVARVRGGKVLEP
jgi:ABC-type phosphate transport system substrate-binding protein